MSKKTYAIVTAVFISLTLASVTYAAFSGKSKILGTSVSVGSADIKLLKEVDSGVSADNLVAEMPGPVLSSIYPGWSFDYLVKVYNNSATSLSLTTNANYTTDNDPAELRQLIYVQPIPWQDANNNGHPDSDELGVPMDRKTIVKWKTEGFNLGTIDSGDVNGYVLRFSTDSIPDTKQGATAKFDFEFNSLGQ